MRCPTPDQLKRFALTGRIQDLPAIETHLGDCEDCQRLLEKFVSLASGQSLWQVGTDLSQGVTSADVDELIGVEFDGYFILERAGSGGSSTVYKALQESTDRIVAIKVMARRNFSDRQVASWRRESRLVARIKHENVISILDAGRAMGYEYCVFEWIDGGSLANQLERFQFEFREAARIALEIARGCVALHQERILHRDIKPSNVLIDQKGRVKLADFGIAQSLDETMTMTSQGSGTPGFMSPEQLGLVSGMIDARTDVYGIGAVVYAMLVGRGPFAGSSVLEVVSNAASHEVRSLSSERPVPRALETICLKCLEKRPESRYETAEALAEDLSRFLKGEPILARPPTAVQRTAKWMRSNLRIVAIAALLMVGLISFWVGQAIRTQQTRRQIAHERLAQVLEIDPTGLSRTLERFQDLREGDRMHALLKTEVNEYDSIQKRLRHLLATRPSVEQLLEFVSDHGSALPLDELTEVFLQLQKSFVAMPGYIPELPETLRTYLHKDDLIVPESELVRLALIASTAPGKLEPRHLKRIVLGLEGNGKLHASVWRIGFAGIAADLHMQLLQKLKREEEDTGGVLLEYCFLFGLDSIQDGREESLAEALLCCPANNLVEFTERLPNHLKKKVAKELLLIWKASPLMDRQAAVAAQAIPADLIDIKDSLERYHSICTKEMLLLPAVPFSEWPALAQRIDASSWSVAEFRPTVVDGSNIVAVTLINDKNNTRELNIDLPESEVESLCVKRAEEGIYPVSIWARPANGENLNDLLITIVWGRSESPQTIRFDERPDDWGIDVENISRSNYKDANRFFLLELGRHEDIEATEAAAKRAGVRNRLEVDRTLTAHRTVGLLRNQRESVASESDEEDLRIQFIAQTNLPAFKMGVVERNFKFQSRPRKLTLEASLPKEHRIQCERLLQLGFLPESCSVTSSKSGELMLASRWSTSYSQADPARTRILAAAVMGSFLLGESAPLIEAFGCDLDRSAASLVCSYGVHLQLRHAEWIARELRQHEDAKVLYSLVLLAGYMQRNTITEELRLEINRLAETCSHAGVLGAVSIIGNCEPEDSTRLSASEVKASVPDGFLTVKMPHHPMVQIVPKNQLAYLGGERFMLWESSAQQKLIKLSYKSFAVGTKPITFRQYHEYQKAQGQELKTLPATCTSVDCPAVEISYYEMLRYCRWLSEEAGIPEHEIGLPPIDEIGPDMEVGNLTQSKGYRLPTDYEWEVASRAGAYTDRFFGHADRLLLDYANIADPSQFTLLQVGKRKPNPYGLFDCYGNCLEMCLHSRHGGPKKEVPERLRQVRTNFIVAGGSFLTHGMYASAGAKLSVTESNSADMQVGFRIARTLEF